MSKFSKWQRIYSYIVYNYNNGLGVRFVINSSIGINRKKFYLEFNIYSHRLSYYIPDQTEITFKKPL